MIIYNPLLVKILSFGFARAMALYPFILSGLPVNQLSDNIINHEKIHLRQQLEMLILPFYIWYFIEYLFKLTKYRSHLLAYRNISFEREAYKNECRKNYLKERKLWAFTTFL